MRLLRCSRRSTLHHFTNSHRRSSTENTIPYHKHFHSRQRNWLRVCFSETNPKDPQFTKYWRCPKFNQELKSSSKAIPLKTNLRTQSYIIKTSSKSSDDNRTPWKKKNNVKKKNKNFKEKCLKCKLRAAWPTNHPKGILINITTPLSLIISINNTPSTSRAARKKGMGPPLNHSQSRRPKRIVKRTLVSTTSRSLMIRCPKKGPKLITRYLRRPLITLVHQFQTAIWSRLRAAV